MITIALIGCSKTKKVRTPDGWDEARNVYDSDLFRKRVAHVESRRLPWYIISAKSALLKPTTPIKLYNRVLDELDEIEIAEWHLDVANMLMTELSNNFGKPRLSSVTIELHAGEKYCEPLGSILLMFGMNVTKPVANLGIGQQLAYYKSLTPLETNACQ
jgi:hypothetical protein